MLFSFLRLRLVCGRFICPSLVFSVLLIAFFPLLSCSACVSAGFFSRLRSLRVSWCGVARFSLLVTSFSGFFLHVLTCFFLLLSLSLLPHSFLLSVPLCVYSLSFLLAEFVTSQRCPGPPVSVVSGPSRAVCLALLAFFSPCVNLFISFAVLRLFFVSRSGFVPRVFPSTCCSLFCCSSLLVLRLFVACSFFPSVWRFFRPCGSAGGIFVSSYFFCAFRCLRRQACFIAVVGPTFFAWLVAAFGWFPCVAFGCCFVGAPCIRCVLLLCVWFSLVPRRASFSFFASTARLESALSFSLSWRFWFCVCPFRFCLRRSLVSRARNLSGWVCPVDYGAGRRAGLQLGRGASGGVLRFRLFVSFVIA